MKRTRRTRAGGRFGRPFAILLLAAASAVPAASADKQPKSYAVIAGTVFRETGLSLAGAEVELTAAGESKSTRKFKRMQILSDARGEFALRVPATPMRYRLIVKAAGYVPQEKEVSVAADERLDVFLQLVPASKK